MQHEIVVSGAAFALRPIADTDAAFVVALRRDPQLGRYLHVGAATTAEQLAWQARYYERDGDYYFVVSRLTDGRADGLVAIYDVDNATRCAEWGRWILRPGSVAAVESALLTYRVAFDTLGLDAVFCRTVGANEAVVSFHDSCGVPRVGRLDAHFCFNGVAHDAIEHRLSRADWPGVEARLDKLARAVARKSRHD